MHKYCTSTVIAALVTLVLCCCRLIVAVDAIFLVYADYAVEICHTAWDSEFFELLENVHRASANVGGMAEVLPITISSKLCKVKMAVVDHGHAY